MEHAKIDEIANIAKIDEMANIAKTILLVSLLVLALALFDHPGRPIFISLFGIYALIVIIIKGVFVEVLVGTLILLAVWAIIIFIAITITNAVKNFTERNKQPHIE